MQKNSIPAAGKIRICQNGFLGEGTIGFGVSMDGYESTAYFDTQLFDNHYILTAKGRYQDLTLKILHNASEAEIWLYDQAMEEARRLQQEGLTHLNQRYPIVYCWREEKEKEIIEHEVEARGDCEREVGLKRMTS